MAHVIMCSIQYSSVTENTNALNKDTEVQKKLKVLLLLLEPNSNISSFLNVIEIYSKTCKE